MGIRQQIIIYCIAPILHKQEVGVCMHVYKQEVCVCVIKKEKNMQLLVEDEPREAVMQLCSILE